LAESKKVIGVISAIILTYNDEEQIDHCLASIANLTDDVVVIDSFSRDRTVDICRGRGARVFQHDFVNQAHQFNWALDSVPLKYEWVLRLDSDEIVPAGLRNEMLARVGRERVVGYYMNRRMYWMNRWLRHGRLYPHYILRLFKRGFARYEERTEEHLVLTGEAGHLQNDFLEDNRKNTLDYFTEKHLKTAAGEVAEILSRVEEGNGIAPKLFGRKVNRTRWLKLRVYNRCPLFVRGILYFLYRYLLCLGFLDGRPGLVFHVLQGFWYRFYIDAKLYEERSGWRDHRNDYKDM
jgi:glycosyltransferase involved in cell wall biosynthesis